MDNEVPYHTHNGIDSPKLDPKVCLFGFPVFDHIPTSDEYNAVLGAIIIVNDPLATIRYKMYGFVDDAWQDLTQS